MDGNKNFVYACKCGFQDPDLAKYRGHFVRDRPLVKGKHKSLGIVDADTGEVILPPYHLRKSRDRKQHAADLLGKVEEGGNGRGGKRGSDSKRHTESLEDAQEVTFISRYYTTTYTPIMRAGRVASHRQWGWRKDMPLENFLDTVIYNYFLEHGIRLAGYIIEDEEEETEEVSQHGG